MRPFQTSLDSLGGLPPSLPLKCTMLQSRKKTENRTKTGREHDNKLLRGLLLHGCHPAKVAVRSPLTTLLLLPTNWNAWIWQEWRAFQLRPLCLCTTSPGNAKLSTTTAREQNRALGREVYGRYPNPGKHRKIVSTIASAGSAKTWGAAVVVVSSALPDLFPQRQQ